MDSAPSIYNHKEPLDYMKAYLDWRAGQAPEFSVRKWCKSLGIKAEVIFDILRDKRKVSMNLVSILARDMRLDPSETIYFEAMIKRSMASSTKERVLFDLVLSEFSGPKGKLTFIEDDSLYTSWVNITVLVMTELPGFDCREDTIKEVLLCEVAQETIDEAINKLLRLKLIGRDPDGRLTRKFDHATTLNDVLKTGVHQYYEQVFELAKQNISTALDQREFQSFTLAIEHEQIPLFKEAIRQFRSKVSAIPSKDPDQLYHFNIQFFPMTRQLKKSEGDLHINPGEASSLKEGDASSM